MGASWIHGIERNPLAALAREASVDFVTASEEVKTIHEKTYLIGMDVDENMGSLFDKLLDQAVSTVVLKKAIRSSQFTHFFACVKCR